MTASAGKFSFRGARPWLPLAFVLLGLAVTSSTFHLPQLTYRYLFVIDITQSMNVFDMNSGDSLVTRLEFAKAAVEAAIRNLPCGSEAGVAIFTEHRTFVLFTPVEICEHYSTLSVSLAKIDWRMAWAARSEVAKGLYSAHAAARQIGDDTRLVYLTDGHEAPPHNKNLAPPFRGDAGSIAGFIGGIGGLVPQRIPHLDERGNVLGYWRHEDVMQIDIYSVGRAASEQGEAMVGINIANIARRIALGQEHLSSLRETHLQRLATQTGLDYARVESPAQFVDTLLQNKYGRRLPVLSDVGFVPASVAFGCLVWCFVALPWRSRPASAGAAIYAPGG